MCALTHAWDGRRDEGGRPLVPDAVLEQLRSATVEHVWHVMKESGYGPQFAGGFLQTKPGNVLVGRCVTSQFLPHRPDLDEWVRMRGQELGFDRDTQQNAWVVDTLREGDALIADIFGKVREGTVLGDNLGSAVAVRTGVGAVIDGGVRDLAGLVELADPVVIFYKGSDPTPIEDVVLASFNGPIKIGGVTVLPGDVVLGTPAGVSFIPAHLAGEVAECAVNLGQRDAFAKERLREGRYSSSEIDVPEWASHIEKDFQAWSRQGVDDRSSSTNAST